MKRLYPHFKAAHPLFTLFYFFSVLVACFLLQNPVFLGICFFCGFLTNWVTHGLIATMRRQLISLPIALCMVLINPLFNHNGMTPLFYINDLPFTLESLAYGGMTALTLINTFLWFSIWNDYMNQDKIIYLFGKHLPTTALMIGMIFKTTSYLTGELHSICFAQKGLGIEAGQGTAKERIKKSSSIFACLLGNALEHSVDTAVAMKSRGYGLGTRSHQKKYRIKKADWFFFLLLCLFIVSLVALYQSGDFDWHVFPSISQLHFPLQNQLAYSAYFFFLLIPLLYNVKSS